MIGSDTVSVSSTFVEFVTGSDKDSTSLSKQQQPHTIPKESRNSKIDTKLLLPNYNSLRRRRDKIKRWSKALATGTCTSSGGRSVRFVFDKEPVA